MDAESRGTRGRAKKQKVAQFPKRPVHELQNPVGLRPLMFGELSRINKNAICAATFMNIGALASMVDILSGVLLDAPFKITGPGFEEGALPEETQRKILPLRKLDAPKAFAGLSLKCVDATKTCIVIARIAADVMFGPSVRPDDTHLKVSVADLSKHIKSIECGFGVHLFFTENSRKLKLKSVSPLEITSHHRTQYMSTMEWDEQDFDLSTLHADFTIEMELRIFQKVIKLGKLLGSDLLRIQILTDKVESNDSMRSFLVMQTFGTTSGDDHVFFSHTKKTQDSEYIVVIKDADEELEDPKNDPSNVSQSSLKTVYRGIFPLEFISGFSRNLQQPIVIMRISSRPGNPIIFSSFFGTFLLFGEVWHCLKIVGQVTRIRRLR